MTDDIAVGMRGQGWSAVGGRVIPPSPGHHSGRTTGPARQPRQLTGLVSFATSDGLLGPGRRLRYRRARWVRNATLWLALVLLAPLVAGWAFGLLGTLAR